MLSYISKLITSTTLVLVFVIFTANSQVVLKAIAVNNISIFKAGDSLNVYGTRFDSNKKKYLIYNGYDYRFINESNIKVFDANIDFWSMQWFNYRGVNYSKNPIKESVWQKRKEKCISYLFWCDEEDYTYSDEFLSDYIYQLLYRIRHKKSLKYVSDDFGIKILKSNYSHSFSLSNGTIYLTTSLLSEIKSEKELSEILTKEVAHLVLGHTISLDSVWEPHLLKYSNIQKKQAEILFNNFQKINDTLNFTANDVMRKQYFSNVISYTAWQEFYNMNYSKAIDLIDRLISSGAATDEDYFLKARIYRKQFNTPESNQQALLYLKKAQKIGVTNLIEIDKESGLIYLRQGNIRKAKGAFENYKSVLTIRQQQGFDYSDEIEKIQQLLYKCDILLKTKNN